MLFYDFEVFKEDWLVVIIDMTKKCEHVIINDPDALKSIYEANVNDIWCGFNNRHYDMYIMKAILLGINPKKVNDWIIVQDREGWQFSKAFNSIPMTNYDVMMATGRIGLKTIEAFLGANIKETEVPFDIDRKLTQEEIDETVKYCRHDVQMTIEAFFQTIDVWNAMYGIVKAFPDMVSIADVGDTEARITAKVLGCRKQEFDDEFDYFILPCIQLKKYKYVQEWFENAVHDCTEEMKKVYADPKTKKSEQYKYNWNDEFWWQVFFYKRSLETKVAGIPHTFGFGGLHGAIDGAVHLTPNDGDGYHVDVNNYYPSMLNAWELVTRAATNDNYLKVYMTRKELKFKQTHAATKEEAKMYKKMQLPYKKMLNALSGGMKDKTNPAYDPRNNNCMCINGQLMLLDLIEHLEVIPGFRLVQSNTDGLIVWIPPTDEAFEMMDDICWEWEQRCSTAICDIRLEFDLVKSIYQKDVNNYLFIADDGSVDRKGRYLKELSAIDNDLPILNKAVVDFMVNGTPVEKTIMECKDLGMFGQVVKLSNLYHHVEHEHCTPRKVQTGVRVIKHHYEYDHTDIYTYKSYRVFASSDLKDGRLLKARATGKTEKFGGTPDHCFIFNDSTHDAAIPAKLDREYYINEAKEILKKFGIVG